MEQETPQQARPVERADYEALKEQVDALLTSADANEPLVQISAAIFTAIDKIVLKQTRENLARIQEWFDKFSAIKHVDQKTKNAAEARAIAATAEVAQATIGVMVQAALHGEKPNNPAVLDARNRLLALCDSTYELIEQVRWRWLEIEVDYDIAAKRYKTFGNVDAAFAYLNKQVGKSKTGQRGK